MPVKAKICGLKTPALVRTALEGRAAFLGFMHVKASPRYVSLDEIASLSHLLKDHPSKAVIVTQNPDDEDIRAYAAIKTIDFIQLHGGETATRLQEIRTILQNEGRKDIGLIWAKGVKTRKDLMGWLDDLHAMAEKPDYLLLDAPPPKGSVQAGGHGEPFELELLSDMKLPLPWMLAGGLRAQNVKKALQQSGADYADVSSGVEVAKGQKSADLIRAFLKTVSEADRP